MASVFHLYCDAFNIKQGIVRKYQDFAESDKKLYFAAVAVQRTWRGYVVRKMVKNWNRAATLVQKYARGWLVRLHLPERLKAHYFDLSVEYYNGIATKIQAFFRGHSTRKMYMNIRALRAQRQELDQISNKMQEEVGKMFTELRGGLWNEARVNVEKIITILFDRHHLLRTTVAEGIFSVHGELSCIEKILKSFPLTDYMKELRDLLHKDKVEVKRSKEKKPQVFASCVLTLLNKHFSFDLNTNVKPKCYYHKIIYRK